MFENIINFFRKLTKKDIEKTTNKDVAKERLHLVLMQDRANVSADFLELMKQEIIDVIKKYIEVDDKAIDVRLTNQVNDDGTNGAPALYANIPIVNMKNGVSTNSNKVTSEENTKVEEKTIEIKEEIKETQNKETEEVVNKETLNEKVVSENINIENDEIIEKIKENESEANK